MINAENIIETIALDQMSEISFENAKKDLLEAKISINIKYNNGVTNDYVIINRPMLMLKED